MSSSASTRFLALVVAVFLACGNRALAESFTMDGVELIRELPKGYCPMTRTQAVENLLYEQQDRLQKGYNKVIQLAVLCTMREAVDGKQTVDQKAMWLLNTPNDTPIRLPAGTVRSAVIDELAKSTPTLDMKSINSDIGDRSKNDGVGLNISSSASIETTTRSISACSSAGR